MTLRPILDALYPYQYKSPAAQVKRMTEAVAIARRERREEAFMLAWQQELLLTHGKGGPRDPVRVANEVVSG